MSYIYYTYRSYKVVSIQAELSLISSGGDSGKKQLNPVLLDQKLPIVVTLNSAPAPPALPIVLLPRDSSLSSHTTTHQSILHLTSALICSQTSRFTPVPGCVNV